MKTRTVKKVLLIAVILVISVALNIWVKKLVGKSIFFDNLITAFTGMMGGYIVTSTRNAPMIPGNLKSWLKISLVVIVVATIFWALECNVLS